MKRPLPVKGVPDFSFLSDEKVREYRELINVMISSYGDTDKKKLLEEMWSDLNAECISRTDNMPEKEKPKMNLNRFNKMFLKNSKIQK